MNWCRLNLILTGVELKWRQKVNKAYTRITKTCPYDIQQFFSGQKSIIFRGKFLIFFLFLLKTSIVGTR